MLNHIHKYLKHQEVPACHKGRLVVQTHTLAQTHLGEKTYVSFLSDCSCCHRSPHGATGCGCQLFEFSIQTSYYPLQRFPAFSSIRRDSTGQNPLQVAAETDTFYRDNSFLGQYCSRGEKCEIKIFFLLNVNNAASDHVFMAVKECAE